MFSHKILRTPSLEENAGAFKVCIAVMNYSGTCSAGIYAILLVVIILNFGSAFGAEEDKNGCV
jgi:hypothetical protein